MIHRIPCSSARICIEAGTGCDLSTHRNTMQTEAPSLIHMYWLTPRDWLISTTMLDSIISESHGNACPLVSLGQFSRCSRAFYNKGMSAICCGWRAAHLSLSMPKSAISTAVHGSLPTKAHHEPRAYPYLPPSAQDESQERWGRRPWDGCGTRSSCIGGTPWYPQPRCRDPYGTGEQIPPRTPQPYKLTKHCKWRQRPKIFGTPQQLGRRPRGQ